jgi:hypothetical protein
MHFLFNDSNLRRNLYRYQGGMTNDQILSYLDILTQQIGELHILVSNTNNLTGLNGIKRQIADLKRQFRSIPDYFIVNRNTLINLANNLSSILDSKMRAIQYSLADR